MKKFLLIFFILSSFASYSQSIDDKFVHFNPSKNNNLTISPFGFINKIRLKYELSTSNHLSIGGYFSGYYGSFKGFQIAPLMRYYLIDFAPEGFYIEGKILFSRYNVWDYENKETYTNPFLLHSFRSMGLGGGIGYQYIAGRKNNLVVDFNLGLKIMSPAFTRRSNIAKSGLDNLYYYTLGPGSLFDGHLGIGYLF
jgi:hypothetical protein